MLNEDKIKIMTGIALFEKREGRRMAPAKKYFRSDYIGRHVLRSFFGFTICSVLLLGIWILCSIEKILEEMKLEELIAQGFKLAGYYVCGLVIYLFITYVIYSRRYSYAVRTQKIYTAKLKHLNKRYEFQTRSKEMAKEGGRL